MKTNQMGYFIPRTSNKAKRIAKYEHRTSWVGPLAVQGNKNHKVDTRHSVDDSYQDEMRSYTHNSTVYEGDNEITLVGKQYCGLSAGYYKDGSEFVICLVDAEGAIPDTEESGFNDVEEILHYLTQDKINHMIDEYNREVGWED